MKQTGQGPRRPGSCSGSVIAGYSTLGLTLYLREPLSIVIWERERRAFPKSILGIKSCDFTKDLVIVFSQNNSKMS